MQVGLEMIRNKVYFKYSMDIPYEVKPEALVPGNSLVMLSVVKIDRILAYQ